MHYSKEAVMQKLQQHVALQELEAALPPGRVSQWTAEVKAWEANREVSNPYRRKREGAAITIFPYPCSEALRSGYTG